jgi:hypothetical protein
MSVTRVKGEVSGHGHGHGHGGRRDRKKDWTSSKSWTKKSSEDW